MKINETLYANACVYKFRREHVGVFSMQMRGHLVARGVASDESRGLSYG